MINKNLVGGMCISKILATGTGYSALTYAECTEAKNNGEIDVEYCYDGTWGNDYYAGAVKACGGKRVNLPTQDQLTQLAKYIYNTDSVSSSGTTSSLAMDTEKATQFPSASPYSSSFDVWSGQEASSTYAYARSFDSTDTGWGNYYFRTVSYALAVCLDN